MDMAGAFARSRNASRRTLFRDEEEFEAEIAQKFPSSLNDHKPVWKNGSNNGSLV